MKNQSTTKENKNLNVLVVYHSMGGHTKSIAEQIAKGAQSVVQTNVIIKPVMADGIQPEDAATRADLVSCDALIMGCPVHQRNVSWEMKRFIDEHCEPCWFYDDLVGRVGGVFTTGGGHGDTGGGAELTQLTLISNLASMGIIVVPQPKTTPGFEYAGMHWGTNARTSKHGLAQLGAEEMNEAVYDSAYHHGANIARVAQAVKNGYTERLFALGNLAPNEQGRQARMNYDATSPLSEPR